MYPINSFGDNQSVSCTLLGIKYYKIVIYYVFGTNLVWIGFRFFCVWGWGGLSPWYDSKVSSFLFQEKSLTNYKNLSSNTNKKSQNTIQLICMLHVCDFVNFDNVGCQFSSERNMHDAPPSSLMDSIVSLKVKTVEGIRVGARSLVRNISGVEGRAGVLGWD